MNVKYNYLPDEFLDTDELFDEWKKLISTTEFTLGPYVSKFEKKFAQYMNAKYCVSTNNGTDALILALKALNIGTGDEVITVTNTFYATVGAIVATGATPVLVDCDDRFQIDIDQIERNITKKTKAVVPVHWGGASPRMPEILKLCGENGIDIIEDACMGIGASIDGKSAGTFGKINAFSMHPLKSLNVMGDGGMVLTNDKDLNSWMQKYRNHGMIDRDNIEFWGVNMRIQPLQAVVAMSGMKRLDKTLKIRRQNAKLLDQGLSELVCRGLISLPERLPGFLETHALYMGLFKKRDCLKKFLEENNIEVKIHYPNPLHKQNAAKNQCRFDSKSLVKATSQADELLTLPVHQFVTTDQIAYMISAISKFYRDF